MAVYVLSECTSACVNDRYSAVSNYLARFVTGLPEVIWVGRVAVSGITRQVYSLPAMVFLLLLLGLWYILALLFEGVFLSPHPECSESAFVEFPEYHIYVIYANFTLTILHDIHWIGVKASNFLPFLFKLLIVSGAVIVPVLNGNITPVQALCSAIIGVGIGLVYFAFLTIKWSAYFDLIERHPVVRYFNFKNTEQFRHKWFM